MIHPPFPGVLGILSLGGLAVVADIAAPASAFASPGGFALFVGGASFGIYWIVKLWNDLKRSDTKDSNAMATGQFEGRAVAILEQLVQVARDTSEAASAAASAADAASSATTASTNRQESMLRGFLEAMKEHDARADRQYAALHEEIRQVSSPRRR